MSKFFTTEIARVHDLYHITVKSKALKKRADITVYNSLPADSDIRSVPLVILLHGVYGSHWVWTAHGKAHTTLQDLVDRNIVAPMILAMPSDGLFADGSAYLPHLNENYEQWIVEDVIQVMKEQFPAIDDQSPIFIAGLSMGGYGAMRLGAKYPHLFKGFSGLSSITHFDQMKLFVEDYNLLQSMVTVQDGVVDWMITHKDRLPPFRFDCGTNDLLIEQNRMLHHELTEHDIPHIYKEYDGEHSWGYWKEHVGETFRFFDGVRGKKYISKI